MENQYTLTALKLKPDTFIIIHCPDGSTRHLLKIQSITMMTALLDTRNLKGVEGGSIGQTPWIHTWTLPQNAGKTIQPRLIR
mmetsp:Transcript_3891/g.6063  ORF Transcript_3891/g.6063 Transcript_3891/m.6063 type:complete len:82 (-) Transcript_3891:336-581(-)